MASEYLRRYFFLSACGTSCSTNKITLAHCGGDDDGGGGCGGGGGDGGAGGGGGDGGGDVGSGGGGAGDGGGGCVVENVSGCFGRRIVSFQNVCWTIALLKVLI